MSVSFGQSYHPFAEKPLSDACWSLSAGPDGRIYSAACVEHTGGHSVTVVRYDEKRNAPEYLFDVADVCGDPPDSGRATQCKIHYSFAPSPATDILYCATHLSGPPKDETHYCPWSAWHDRKRAFMGAMLVAYDTKRDAVLWSELMIPREGCRCLALDEARGRLYAITYPRDHFVVYDLKTKTLRDVGRVGSVNCQCIFMDRIGRAYFTDDMGRVNRYDPERERLERLPILYPHAAYQTGWHGVIYDAVGCGEAVYMLPWMAGSRLVRYWPMEGPHGRMEDLGLVNQARDESFVISLATDHAGGLVVGGDGRVYFVCSRWKPDIEQPCAWNAAPSDFTAKTAHGDLVAFDPATGKMETVLTLQLGPDAVTSSQYVSRGARDHDGNLYFAHIGSRPSGFFRVTTPWAKAGSSGHLPLRMWG